MSFGGGSKPVATKPSPVPNIYADQAAGIKADQAKLEEQLRAKRGRSSTMYSGAMGLLGAGDPNTSASASSLLS